MTLFTKKQLEQLQKNALDDVDDHIPVVKIFTPDANATWLFTELRDYDGEDGILYGLCSLLFVELGCVSLRELLEVRGGLGLTVERDKYFEAEMPLSGYTGSAKVGLQYDMAREIGYI